MVRGLNKEHTTCRVRCELMRSSGSKVRVASAPEDTKVSVSGRGYRRERGEESKREKRWKEDG
jgi:hypothetical protein